MIRYQVDLFALLHLREAKRKNRLTLFRRDAVRALPDAL